MPVTKELSQEILETYEFQEPISPEIRSMLQEDFEKALTFLVGDKPWLTESDNLRHKALYLELTDRIRAVFWLKRKDAWPVNAVPEWLQALIAYWHHNRCAVITLNYDTLIEQVASEVYCPKRRPQIPTGELYPIRLTPAVIEPTKTGELSQTFRLFKLHGSINWFYSGRSNFFGEELLYVPCKGGVDDAFGVEEHPAPFKVDWCRLRGGKTSLIIPPTLDKSAFFQHEALRSMWFQAGEAIKQASRVICLGYSLPSSDLTMAHFLKTSAPSSGIPFEIVDLELRDRCESKVEHFERIIGKSAYEFRQQYSGKECVETFVLSNLNIEPKDDLPVCAA